jgi:hypothetical protein
MKYAESSGLGFFKAVFSSTFLTILGFMGFVAAKVPFIRRKLPMPGMGPSQELMDKGFFIMENYALSDKQDGGHPHRVKATIKVRLRWQRLAFLHSYPWPTHLPIP